MEVFCSYYNNNIYFYTLVRKFKHIHILKQHTFKEDNYYIYNNKTGIIMNNSNAYDIGYIFKANSKLLNIYDSDCRKLIKMKNKVKQVRNEKSILKKLIIKLMIRKEYLVIC